MKDGPISPKLHGIIDYGLVAALLVLPAAFRFSRNVRRLYAAEAAALLVYVALTDHPTAVLPLIPFRTHGKIDPFNVLNFAAHSLLKPFRKDKGAQLFNAAFTALAGATVALTAWDAPAERGPRIRGMPRAQLGQGDAPARRALGPGREAPTSSPSSEREPAESE